MWAVDSKEREVNKELMYIVQKNAYTKREKMQSWTCDWELVEYWDKVIADKSLTDKYFRELKEDLANFKIDIRGVNIS